MTCGQGADEDPGTEGGGLQCLLNGRRVLVAKGVVRFIRFNKTGDVYALGWVRQDLRQARLQWFSRAELEALPTYKYTIGPIDPPIDPPVDPVEPGQPPTLPDDVFAALKTLRPAYPTPLGDQGSTLLNAVAWQFRAQGWGLELKVGGNNCPQPTTGIRTGCDILRGPGNWGYDVLGDQENLGLPLQATAGPADPARFVPPVKPPVGPIDPPIDPPVDVCTPALAACKADVARLTAENDQLKGDIARETAENVRLTRELAELQAKYDALLNAPAPVYTCEVSPSWVRFIASCKVVPPVK